MIEIRVLWSSKDKDLPIFVNIPKKIARKSEKIVSYLYTKYNCAVIDWEWS